jgi:hypothetical protein
MYCWFASPQDRALNQTKCLPLYSQDDGTIFGWYQLSTVNGAASSTVTLDDYTINGKYCASGLAYPISDNSAKCTSMKTVTFGSSSTPLDFPYACDPTNYNNKCHINFNVDSDDSTYAAAGNRAFVQVPCRCSLGGPKDPMGFCQSILGSDTYAEAVAELSNVLGSSSCHTLDRNDMRAQKD